MDNDVDMLIPAPEVDDNVPEFKESAEQISRTFFKIGITQLVLGLIVLIGGILITAISDPWRDVGVDVVGEGIWCGIFVLVCGFLAVTSRYHLQFGVVVASLVMNLITTLLLLAGIVLATISFFGNGCARCPDEENAGYLGFTALNCGLIPCTILSIYMAIVYAKILNENGNRVKNCCIGAQSQYPNAYTMAYVAPGGQQPNVPRESGVFIAAPYAQAV